MSDAYAGFGTTEAPTIDPYAGFDAVPKAVGSVLDDPVKAGKSLELSKTLKQPPSAIYGDFDAAHQEAMAKRASMIVDSNPYVRDYVNNVPLAASVSNDDWGNLSRYSTELQTLTADSIVARERVGLFKGLPEVAGMLGDEAGRTRLWSALKQMPQALLEGMVHPIMLPGNVASGKVDLNTPEGIDEVISAGIGLSLFQVGKAKGTGPGRDIRTGKGEPPPGVSTPAEIDAFLARVRGLKTREEIDAFLAEKSGANAPVRLLVHAQSVADRLTNTVKVAQEVATKARSVEAVEAFGALHETGRVHVPARAILELYQAEGKVPLPGDGLFGFIPGLADKMTLAAASGGEIAVPMSKYIANIDPTVHEKISEVVRVHEKGVTVEEAKEVSKEAEEKAAAGPEVFHGSAAEFTAFDITKLGTGEGAQAYGVGHYVAEQPQVALEYKEAGLNKKLSLPEHEASVVLSDYRNRAAAIEAQENFLARLEPSSGRYADVKASIDLLKSGWIPPQGNLYKAQILRPVEEFLDWDKPLAEQPLKVQQFVKDFDLTETDLGMPITTGETILQALADKLKTGKKLPPDETGMYRFDDGREAASKALSEAGIAGIKYLDQGSRPEGKGTSNYVVFRDEDLLVTHRNEQPINPNTLAAVASVEKEAASLGISKPELFTDPFIKDQKALNILRTMLKDYANLIDRRQEMILTKAVAVAEREVKKTQTSQWKKDEAEMVTEVEADFRSRPDLAADRFLRDGELPSGERTAKIKFNKTEVEAVTGEGSLPRYVTDGEGANLGLVAQTFGFNTGADMLRALDALAQARKLADKGPKAHTNLLIKEEVARRMEAKYGNLKTNIAVEASEIALQDYNVDLLSAQWRMLAKAAGVELPIDRGNLTTWAREQFGMAEVGQVGYEGYRRDAQKANVLAEKSLLKGEYLEALQAKQTQMLNFLLAQEAKAFEKRIVAPNERLIGRYAGTDTLPGVDQAYTDQIHGLLQTYGVDLARTRQNIDYNLQGVNIATFIDTMNQNGALMPKPPLPTPGPNVTLDNFTVDQYTDFANLLKSLDHNGKQIKTIEVAGKRENHFQMVDRTLKNLDNLEKKGFDPAVKGPVSALRLAGRYVDSKLLKAEKLIDWIDHEDPLGPMNTILRGLVEGEHKKGAMITKLSKMVAEMPMSREWGKKLNELADNKELVDRETGEFVKVTNEQKIVMALNYGNMGNRNVMLRSGSWTEGEMESFLSRTMTKMDWDAVAAIHDLFKPLAPLVEEVTRKRSGLAVPLVEPSAFLQSKGGYFPLIQDPRSVLIGAKVSTDLFDKTKFDPLPMAPALKQRTGAVYPLDLSLNRLHNIISQTVHAVYLQDPVINANKIIKDPLVREGVAKAFGPEYVKLFDDWIKDIANNGGMSDDAMASWISRNLRENVVVMLMGYKVSTALIHGGSAGAASLYEMGKMHLEEKGPKSFVLAPAELIKNVKALGIDQFLPEEARRFFANSSNTISKYEEVMSKSLELQNRQRALQKDFGYQLGKLVNKNLIDDAAQLRAVYHAYAMSMVAYLDLLTATPVWLAAEAKALHDGFEPADAIFIADKAVREAHGSASLISRANIGRGEINKWMTIAYNGYWNHNYNKSREVSNIMVGRSGEPPKLPPPGFSGRDTGGPDPTSRFTTNMKLALLAGFGTAMLVAGAVIHHAVRGDEEESALGPGSLLSQLAGQVPVINTLFYAFLHNRDPQISPIEEILKSTVNVARDVKKTAEGGEPKRPIAHAAKFVGFTTGMAPTNQIIDLMSFLNDVQNDDQSPEGVGQWFNGVISGKAERKHKR